MKIEHFKQIKKIMLLVIMTALLVNLASAESMETDYSVAYESSSGQIRLVNLRYEPYPVNPGEYFDIWIKVQKSASFSVKEATFELVPEYPFSIDSNENALRTYGELTTDPVVLRYKVRVNKDAVEGINKLKLRYNTNGDANSWMIAAFDIDVSLAQTDFDAVVQEINGNEVSIAIANIGKKDANSIIIKVPEQEYFEAAGTSGQMVGNLEAGDYTLISFEITEKQDRNNPLMMRFENETAGDGSHKINVVAGKNTDNPEKTLKFQIDYTDAIGERRSVIKEVPFASSSYSAVNATSALARRMGTQTSQKIYASWWFWAVIAVILCAGWTAYKKFKKKKELLEEKKAKKRQH